MTQADQSNSVGYTNAQIVDHHDLRFDAGDPLNGSLYLCTARGAPAPLQTLAAMRAAGLWSPAPEKLVPDEQREAYKSGLQFVAAARFSGSDGEVLIARFDHPRYPSDAGRWAAWMALFEQQHERLD